MITVQAFNTVDIDLLKQLISGYVSHEKYEISWQDDVDTVRFQLQLVPLQTPYIKHFELEDTAHYAHLINAGLSLATYDGTKVIALALADYQQWSRTFWIHEFHVLNSYRGQGVGWQLMNAVIEKAHSIQSRIIVCETQNTNVPAIRFYRRMGFSIEAVDISLYTNQDLPDGEVAIFMKRHLVP